MLSKKYYKKQCYKKKITDQTAMSLTKSILGELLRACATSSYSFTRLRHATLTQLLSACAVVQ